MSEPINVLPALALRGTTILPGMIIHFDVSRERSKKAIEAAMFQDQKIFLVTQKDPQIEDPGFVQLFQVGTIAYIKQVVKLPDNLLRVLVAFHRLQGFFQFHRKRKIFYRLQDKVQGTHFVTIDCILRHVGYKYNQHSLIPFSDFSGSIHTIHFWHFNVQ